MKSRTVAFLMACAMVAGVPALSGQERIGSAPADVGVGSRVRVFSSTHVAALEGKVLDLDGESIMVSAGGGLGALRLPFRAVDKLEVSHGRWPRTLKAALAGFGLGSIVGALAYKPDPMGCADGLKACSRLEAAAGFGLLAAGGGAYWGFQDRWKPVALDRVHIGVQPGRRIASAAVSVAF